MKRGPLHLRHGPTAILSSVTDGIAATDATGHILYANDAAANLFAVPSTRRNLSGFGCAISQRFTIEDEAASIRSGRIFPSNRP